MVSKKTSPKNKFFITAVMDGVHQLCFSASPISSTPPGSTVKLTFEIFVGDKSDPTIISPMDAGYFDLAHKINSCNSLASEVAQEQNKDRERQEVFRKLSMRLNSQTVWWALLQAFVLVAVFVAQFQYLKRFFAYKKLI